MAQARNDEPAHEGRITEPYLGLGRVDVHVDFLGRDIEEEGEYRMPITRQHIGIGPAHRADQQPVLHRAAIDEQILVVGHPPVEGRQAGNSGQPRRSAFKLDRHPIAGQLARDDLADPGRQLFTRPDRQHPPPVVLKHKADIGTRHGQAPDHIEASGIFAAGRTKELAPHRHFAEQVLNPDPRARRQGRRSFLNQCAMIDHPPPAFTCTARPAFERQPRN